MIALPKPSADKITLTTAGRRKLLDQLYIKQAGCCVTCGRWMTREAGWSHTATLDHKIPEPMGAKKNDNADNLQAMCWECNDKKGSKR